jgi:deoxyribose-phosphate aldolase
MDGVRFCTASVCIPPSYVRFAKECTEGRIPVCTVVGFPNGYNTTAAKYAETADALNNGADEIDMVIHIGRLKMKDYAYVEDEIKQLKTICGENILKVIIEACLLSEEEKVAMCRIVTNAGADFIKTSTGFSTGGATREDIALFAANIGAGVKDESRRRHQNPARRARFSGPGLFSPRYEFHC